VVAVSAGRGAGVEVVLEVEDLDAAREQVEAAGYPIAEPLETARGACATFGCSSRRLLPAGDD
jgi:hypothetical protein